MEPHPVRLLAYRVREASGSLTTVGSRTVKLYTVYQLNRAGPVDGIPFSTATINERRPDPSEYRRFYTSNGSRAYFDAARITLTTPRWQGGTVTTTYWFSKSIDQGTDYAVTGGGQERWRSSQTEWDYTKDQKGLRISTSLMRSCSRAPGARDVEESAGWADCCVTGI